jgi:hypothetical protein
MLVDVTSYKQEQAQCGIDTKRDAEAETRRTTGRSRTTGSISGRLGGEKVLGSGGQSGLFFRPVWSRDP